MDIIIFAIVSILMELGVGPVSFLVGGAVLGLIGSALSQLQYQRRVVIQDSSLPSSIIEPPDQVDSPKAEQTAWTVTSKSDGTEVWELDDGQQTERQRLPGDDSEVVFLKRRIEEELHAKWAVQRLVLDPPAARIVGRIARIDHHDPEASQKAFWLAFPDDEGNYQAVMVRGLAGDLGMVSAGDALQVALTWKYGRLTLTEIEEHITADLAGPMPEVKLPEAKPKDASSKDGKLPTMDELDKTARESEWGSLNHSVYRFQVPVHITMSPKYRAKSLEGRAIEVQTICREVAEAEGLNVIALAAEDDHLHLLGLPAGKGGCPPTWQWSRWVGRFKALTSKRLKALPGLEAFQWQTGYALTAVHGGKQSSEESLEVVRRYVMSQGHQEDQEGSLDAAEGSEEGEG
ncbi:Transposase IS200 like protein [compost metagenome]